MLRILHHTIHKQKLYQFIFDTVLVVLVVLVALLFQSATPMLGSPTVLLGAVLMATGVSAIHSTLGIYLGSGSLSASQLRWRALGALCLSLPLAYLVFRLPPLPQEDRHFFGLALVSALVLMLLYRTSMAGHLAGPAGRVRVLIYGSGSHALRVGQLLQASDPHVEVVGYYGHAALKPEDAGAVALPNLFGSSMNLSDLVQKERVSEIVVAMGERRGGRLHLRELLDCKLHGVRVLEVAAHFEQTLGQIRRDAVSAGWLVFGEGFERSWLRSAIKRLFDIVGACLLLLQGLPIMAMAALMIMLETGRPIFYLQERVGLDGKPFRMLKFRSMRTDAEGDGQARWASKSDDRVTRVGRFIRRHRIDELPQLFNVLWGDMSLVGPRPERPCFVNSLSQNLPYYGVRHSVKPGITGWAQVRYQYGASEDDASRKLEYDLYYVKNQCLLLDLVILVETVGVVLTCRGAQ